MDKNEDPALQELLSGHFADKLDPQRGALADRIIKQLPRLEPLPMPLQQQRSVSRQPPQQPSWVRWMIVSVGSAAAACILTVLTLNAFDGTPQQPGPGGSTNVVQVGNGGSAGKVAVETSERVVNTGMVGASTDEGIGWLDDKTPARRIHQHVYRRVLLVDPKTQTETELFIPYIQVEVLQHSRQ